MQIEVRAYPAPGHEYRRRAGRAWSSKAVVVEVVDAPVGDGQISPAQLAILRTDPMIAAVPVGAATTGDLESAAIAARLSESEKALASVRAELADAIEQIEASGRALSESSERDRARAEHIKALEAEVAMLRAAPKPKR